MSVLRQALRFTAVGLVNTGVSLAVIYGVMLLPGATAVAANAIGYATGLPLSFAVHRAWTFGCKAHSGVLLPQYVLAVAACYALNLSALMGGLSYLHMPPFLAQLLGVAVYTSSLFAISRCWVFRPRGPQGVSLNQCTRPPPPPADTRIGRRLHAGAPRHGTVR